ncbi:hypothetical protein GGS20DRAFT_87255 [Poronia punctata]|nr:hypothetical protein GGS20DRAFT_87255 [Poronia punctata]
MQVLWLYTICHSTVLQFQDPEPRLSPCQAPRRGVSSRFTGYASPAWVLLVEAAVRRPRFDQLQLTSLYDWIPTERNRLGVGLEDKYQRYMCTTTYMHTYFSLLMPSIRSMPYILLQCIDARIKVDCSLLLPFYSSRHVVAGNRVSDSVQRVSSHTPLITACACGLCLAAHESIRVEHTSTQVQQEMTVREFSCPLSRFPLDYCLSPAQRHTRGACPALVVLAACLLHVCGPCPSSAVTWIKQKESPKQKHTGQDVKCNRYMPAKDSLAPVNPGPGALGYGTGGRGKS